MTGSVVQFKGKGLDAEFASFVGASIVGSRDLGNANGDLNMTVNPTALALAGVLTAAVRPEPAVAAKGPANRFQGLNS